MAYKDPLDPRSKAAKSKHYYENKEQYLERNRIKKQEMREYVKNIKDKPCMDCGNEYASYVMDLHHRDADDKVDVINAVINRGSWNLLYAELEKCDVICANCHRIRHYDGIGLR